MTTKYFGYIITRAVDGKYNVTHPEKSGVLARSTTIRNAKDYIRMQEE